MGKRRQIVEILAPTLGIKADAPTDILDPRSQPTGQNFKNYFGINQKEYGTSLYATGVTAVLNTPINHLYEAQFPNAAVLQIFTPVSVYKYTSSGDTYAVDGQTFTGTFSDYWSSVVHNDALLYSNGIDPIQVKPSVGATGTNLQSAVSPTTYKAWGLVSFREHLNLYHTIENGTEYYKRVRWTKKGVLSYSAGTTDFESGTAGAIDVQDCEGEIKLAAPLADGTLAVYSERSIHIQYFVGGDEIYRFEKAVSGVGTPSRRGVVSYEGVNFVFSHDNVYIYYGGSDVKPIGDPIRKYMFSELNGSAIGNVYVEYDPTEREALFHIPTGSNEFPDTTWVYRIQDDAWARLKRNYTAYGRTTRKTGLTWGELTGNWGAQNYNWGFAQIRVDAALRVYGDRSGRVVKVDKTVYSLSESGTTSAQTYIYETPDITSATIVDPNNKTRVDFTSVDKRWSQYIVQMTGNGTAAVFYSIDKGATFQEFPDSPVTLNPANTTYALDLEERGEQIRMRIVNTGLNEFVGVGYQKIEFLPGSENR